MTGEQSVLVFGVLITGLFVVLLSVGGRKKKTDTKSPSGSSNPSRAAPGRNREQRRKRRA